MAGCIAAFSPISTTIARARTPDGPDGNGTHQGWAFAWPDNRRTLYNRASADPHGRPWSERKHLVWWDEDQAKWTGNDTPDFVPTKRPDMRPDWDKQPRGMDALGGDDPFIMEADGKCMLFVPSGLKDGPLPTYYEPVESPVENPLYGQQTNPVREIVGSPRQRAAQTAGSALPLCIYHLSADRAALRRDFVTCDSAYGGAAA